MKHTMIVAMVRGEMGAAAASGRELASASTHLAKHPANKRSAFEDIIWALLNATELPFID
jgi:hypothetical protein